MRVLLLILIVSTSVLATLQPTTLCGYAPDGSILDMDPSLIVTFDLTDDEQYSFCTSHMLIVTDNKFNIMSIGVLSDINVTELGISLPCTAKQLFELLGMPNEVDEERYVYKYDYGRRSYSLILTKDHNNKDNIYLISLIEFPSWSFFDIWKKATKAYNSGK